MAVCSFELLFQWALISHQILYLDMGTQNLLPFLSKYARKVSLDDLRGEVRGIDEFGITPNMKLAEENRRRERYDYAVSPYESDAQLTYLQKIGLVDYILSQDSDLLDFGSTEFTKVIFKINFYSLDGELIV